MDKSVSLFIHLFILGVLVCLTTAVSLRHKRNVMAEYKWPEPDPNTDHFAHESSCHHYYLVISEEDITINKCPQGELFDYVEHKCKEKESARCWSRHFGKPKHHHIALKSMGSFTCPYAWGKYPDINDCTKYYACLGGKVKHKKCAPFEHFDKISRKCVATITGVCADKTDVVERDFKCPRNWGSFTFHKDCSKYYECLDKKPNLRTCPIDTLFHERKGKCVTKHHVHCSSRHNPYSKNDESSTTAKVRSENLSTTASEYGKSSIESEAVSDVKISPKVEISREVQSDNRVTQTPQPPKNSETVEITNSVSDSTPNETRKTSVENEPKSDVNISSDADINAEEKPFITKASQTPRELTTVEISHSGSNSTPKEAKSDVMVSTSKDPTSGETKSLTEDHTFRNIPLNDTDEIPDSLNTNEFIEVSTNSEASVSTSRQTIAAESFLQRTKEDSTGDKKDQQTTMESSQATPFEECNPKDYTCITDEEGRVIRCPEPNGVFPHPGDERRFLQCKHREIHVKFCPGNMIFSSPVKKCISKIIF